MPNLPANFSALWRAWWVALQPSWRVNAEDATTWPLPRIAPPSSSDTWTSLNHAGPNGLFYVLLTLVWWSQDDSLSSDADDLALSIADVRWVMEQLAHNPQKRAVDSDPSARPISKRRRG